MPSPGRRAVEAWERVDNFAHLRKVISRISSERSDWAGIPMPLDGERLIIEPKFPNAAALAEIGPEPRTPSPGDEEIKVRNSWWSRKLNCEVVIYEEAGKIKAFKWEQPRRRLDLDIATMKCSVAWGIEQEQAALQLLGTLLRHNMFKSYLLTGMFLETSKRSGLTYMFRRLKPTVVLDARNPEDPSKKLRVLCALCIHPIAYYENTWAGAMTPSDEIIAVLMLMRGDEHLLWKRSNQHEPWRPEAAL